MEQDQAHVGGGADPREVGQEEREGPEEVPDVFMRIQAGQISDRIKLVWHLKSACVTLDPNVTAEEASTCKHEPTGSA